MAQKDKVKELVGRGLDSYHTKALQQMDRIEKKNKEQNHKISILSNELDNDYLTKSEEGSVISLEHSKEGMVYLDELQGNTLVNYCTDGSKELTLNGDIDVEGTFVTTTEGVDNGKVDVYCEGNTLVNLASYKHKYQISVGGNGVVASDVFTMTNQTVKNLKGTVNKNYSESGASYIYYQLGRLNMDLLKTSTTYTIILDNKTDFIRGIDLQEGSANNKHTLSCKKVNQNIFVITTKNSFEGLYPNNVIIYGHIVNEYKGNVDVSVLSVLEGDWSNRELPSHFEGMKSVGQDDENGHKIEILSRNKNLWNVEVVKKQNGVKPSYTKNNNIITYSEIGEYGIYVPIKVKKGETLRISGTVKNVQNIRIFKASDNFKDMGIYNRDYNGIETEVSPHYICTFPEDGEYHIRIWCKSTGTPILTDFLAEISSANTTYVEHKSNKKEILINEPLRSVPNGVKDRIVKIGGKYFIERNCKQVRLELKSGALFEELETEDTIVAGIWNYSDKKYHKKNIINHINDTFTDVDDRNNQNEYIHSDGWNTNFFIRIKKSRLTENTLQGVKNWLQNNPINLVYELATPTYEPLEIEPTLNTYNDITHISNNSIIPCNMKIKNTGYNAIIKPSTLYTVAIGTDKGGTIGMSLGGTKVTTTNNVAKITTPATLTDDSLRLYGKGRKGSKIRILEGDIVNIPKHFTGIQSSFEDKVQEDGTYKMEVLSNNENLFRLEDIKYSTLAGNSARPIKNGFKIITDTVHYWHAVVSMELNVKPKTTYTLGVSKKVVINAYPSQEPSWGAGYVFIREYGDKVLTEGKVKDNTRTYFRFNSGENTKIRVTFATATDVATQKGEYDFTDLDLRESKSNLEYVDNKYNKIQFSSIEPLRGVGDVKDRFVFKDGKLMIERNCKQVTLNGLETNIDLYNTEHDKIAKYAFRGMKPSMKLNKIPKCDKFSSKFYNGSINIESVSIGGSNDLHIYINKSRLINVSVDGFKQWLQDSPMTVTYELAEPTYEEVPFELQKIILEGYENGTLFIDTNIPPTSTVTYAGETPIVKATKLNKTEVLNNTEDINDNIIPYLCDMDYRVVLLQLTTGNISNISMARLFGSSYEMLKRDIMSKRYSKEEYLERVQSYYELNKVSEDEKIHLLELIERV